MQALLPPPTFVAQAKELDIVFEAGDIARLGRYLALLLDANTRFNLTAITDPDQAWSRHILDSLTLMPYVTSAQARKVIDVGSGGGLPGIPLAIVLPQVQFTLLEATGKKARFLEQVSQELELANVSVVKERAEVVGQDHDRHRASYDVVIARAVGILAVLVELSVPLAKVGGHVLAMKGQKAEEEIAQARQALHMLHAHVVNVVPVPTGRLVIIEKQRTTPRAYPRKPGEPKRAPLH